MVDPGLHLSKNVQQKKGSKLQSKGMLFMDVVKGSYEYQKPPSKAYC